MKKSAVVIILLVAAFLGMADSWYLASSKFEGTPLTCNINGLDGCNVVAQSPYSELLGIPLAVYGLGFYILVFALTLAIMFVPHRQLARILFGIAALGLVASAIFVLIQIVIIKAVCLYCLGSAVLSVVIFLAAGKLFRSFRPPTPVVVPWGQQS